MLKSDQAFGPQARTALAMENNKNISDHNESLSLFLN